MRFFARVVFIFNICFIIAGIFRFVNIGKRVAGQSTSVLGYQPLESTIAVLGYLAIFVNIVFVILFFARYSRVKMNNIPKWIVFFNIFLLIVQVYYFFFSKF